MSYMTEARGQTCFIQCHENSIYIRDVQTHDCADEISAEASKIDRNLPITIQEWDILKPSFA